MECEVESAKWSGLQEHVGLERVVVLVVSDLFQVRFNRVADPSTVLSKFSTIQQLRGLECNSTWVPISCFPWWFLTCVKPVSVFFKPFNPAVYIFGRSATLSKLCSTKPYWKLGNALCKLFSQSSTCWKLGSAFCKPWSTSSTQRLHAQRLWYKVVLSGCLCQVCSTN